MATVKELEVAGMVKVFTVGSVVSPETGTLVASPGNVLAVISVRFE